MSEAERGRERGEVLWTQAALHGGFWGFAVYVAVEGLGVVLPSTSGCQPCFVDCISAALIRALAYSCM